MAVKSPSYWAALNLLNLPTKSTHSLASSADVFAELPFYHAFGLTLKGLFELSQTSTSKLAVLRAARVG